MYKILQLVSNSTSTTDYWSFVLDMNNAVYSTDDKVVLEDRLIELLKSIPISKLKVVIETDFSEDLLFIN